MKRLIPIIFALLLLTGCQVKEYTPEMPQTFSYNATVTSGDFSYNCRICRSESGSIEVRVMSTNATGLVMSCDGKSLDFNYADYSYSINANGFAGTNPAIVLYEVFDYIHNSPQLVSKKLDNGYRYDGKTSLGDFVLIQNDDNTFKTLTIKAVDFKIEFKN